MLTHLDEHFYHQIPTTMDRVADSDPRWVDNHWFQAMDTQGRFVIGANIAISPNNGVVDGGQIVVHGNTQYNLRYSRAWKQQGLFSERLNLRLGPQWMDILEPGRKARFVLGPDNEHGMSYDLIFDTYLKPQEARTPVYRRGNGPPDILPYHQHLGRFTGWLKIAGQTYEITPETCWGQRDRCWAMLGGFGEKYQPWMPPPKPGAGRGSLHWHSHIQFEDIGFWWWLEERFGAPRVNGTIADNRGGVFDGCVTWPIDDKREQLRLLDFKDYDMDFQPVSGKFRSARAMLVDEYGKEYKLRFEILAPNATRWVLGEGYGDPEFLGGFNGEYFHRWDKYDLDTAEGLAKATFGVTGWNMGEHAVRCEYDGRIGYGHMELLGTPPLPQWGIVGVTRGGH